MQWSMRAFQRKETQTYHTQCLLDGSSATNEYLETCEDRFVLHLELAAAIGIYYIIVNDLIIKNNVHPRRQGLC